ncbi:MAG TPA: enolase C-terminal domain-like protein, partial [bacterium]|nr:enolase C-terminal domain-like protein [bacterium]
MRIKSFDVFRLQIPFRLSFSHIKAARRTSDSVLLRCTLADGTVGYGESLPRPYVTGETMDSVADNLANRFLPTLKSFDPSAFEEVSSRCENLYEEMHSAFPEAGKYIGASVCAVELALLDAFGKHFDEPCIPTGSASPDVRFSSVIGSCSKPVLTAFALATRLWGFQSVKLKIGTDRDDENLRLAHRLLGKRVQLRVDVNGVWSADQALRWLEHNMLNNLVAMEQPVAADDFDGLKRLTKAAPIDIMADESLRDLEDARMLSDQGCCRAFNIRISKCGGLYHSLKIARLANDRGLSVQIGCQVGETSILGAAQLRLVHLLGRVRFLEGCYGSLLLKQDLTKTSLRFGRSGALPDIPKG